MRFLQFAATMKAVECTAVTPAAGTVDVADGATDDAVGEGGLAAHAAAQKPSRQTRCRCLAAATLTRLDALCPGRALCSRCRAKGWRWPSWPSRCSPR